MFHEGATDHPVCGKTSRSPAASLHRHGVQKRGSLSLPRARGGSPDLPNLFGAGLTFHTVVVWSNRLLSFIRSSDRLSWSPPGWDGARTALVNPRRLASTSDGKRSIWRTRPIARPYGQSRLQFPRGQRGHFVGVSGELIRVSLFSCLSRSGRPRAECGAGALGSSPVTGRRLASAPRQWVAPRANARSEPAAPIPPERGKQGRSGV